MSKDNLDLLRRSVEELWNAGDLESYMELYADDAELQPDARFPEGGTTIRGRDEIKRFFEKIHEPVAFGEFQDLDDKVLVSFTWGVSATSQGYDETADWTLVYTFHEAKVTRAQYFRDEQDALRSVGLR